MKYKLATALIFAAAFAGTAFCDTISFATPTGDLGTSHTYTLGSTSVTAYGYNFGFPNNTATDLYGKNAGGTESGLGIANTGSEHEITSSTFISLDVSQISGPFSLSIGSTQGNEGFVLCFETSKGVTGGSRCTSYNAPLGDPDVVSGLSLPGGDSFITIRQDGRPEDGNVLLDSITYTTAATPEPSSLMLLGTGILGAAGVIRRKLSV
jgi:hypothetical protein